MSNSFNDFSLGKEILKSIDGLGYVKPSEVQAKVIPEILSNKDIVVKSQTGSGKTAAFGIPLCEKIIWDENKPQVLILSPTRELAMQVSEDISNIGRFKRIKSLAVFGKQPITEQQRSLKQKTHVVVGTPGRVLDHIERGSLEIDKIDYLVIDEADEMLNMGFISQVESIINKLKNNKQTMLFSATIPEEIKLLCTKYMINPTDIWIKNQKLITDNIDHKLYYVSYEKKLEFLNKVLIYEKPDSLVVFCKTKENVDNVYTYIRAKGYSSNKIHGGLLQKERTDIMNQFKRGDFRILIATDLVARGIDVDGITCVINYDLPVEKEAYVHRIGRTGRAGKKGQAISFCIKEGDKYLDEIEKFIGFNIPIYKLEDNKLTSDEYNERIDFLKLKPKKKKIKSININKQVTKLYLNGGKKKKIRPGDIVGAITKIDGINVDDIGIIDIQEIVSYVDILNGKGNTVLKGLENMTIKGKKLNIDIAKK